MSLEEFKTRRIFIFKNGDSFTEGKKFVVSPRVYRNYEQFLHALSQDVKLENGAVRKVFSMDGKLITSLEDIVNDSLYVISNGESYKKAYYHLKDGDVELDLKDEDGNVIPGRLLIKKRESKVSKHLTDSLKKHQQSVVEKGIFTSTTKGFRIVVFQNGEPTRPGSVAVMNYKNCKSFDQLLLNLTSIIHLQSGYVQKVFDAETGVRLTSLDQLHDGQNLVAAGFESFRKSEYALFNPLEKAVVLRQSEDIPRKVTFYPNGDAYHTGWIMSITNRRFSNLNKLLDYLNSLNGVFSGNVRRIVAKDPPHEKITVPLNLVNGTDYVCLSGNDHLVDISYNQNAPRRITQGALGLSGYTKHNEFMSSIRKISVSNPRKSVFAGIPPHQVKRPVTSKIDSRRPSANGKRMSTSSSHNGNMSRLTTAPTPIEEEIVLKATRPLQYEKQVQQQSLNNKKMGGKGLDRAMTAADKRALERSTSQGSEEYDLFGNTKEKESILGHIASLGTSHTNLKEEEEENQQSIQKALSPLKKRQTIASPRQTMGSPSETSKTVSSPRQSEAYRSPVKSKGSINEVDEVPVPALSPRVTSRTPKTPRN